MGSVLFAVLLGSADISIIAPVANGELCCPACWCNADSWRAIPNYDISQPLLLSLYVGVALAATAAGDHLLGDCLPPVRGLLGIVLVWAGVSLCARA